MVVLPTDYKYREDIFDGITDVLLSSNSNYTNTYAKLSNKLQRNISHRDYSKYLNKMVREGWIEKIDSGQRGTSVMISLTVKALRCHSLKIGFIIGNKYEKAYQYLLSQAALGSTHLVSLPEPQAGGAVVFHPGTNKVLAIVKTETVEGVSELDLLERKHHGNGGIFRHLLFTKDEVRDYFKLLYDSRILIPIAVTANETRYCVLPDLKEFFVDCWSLIHRVLNSMESIWKQKRRPTNDEQEWYKLLFGEKEAMIRFASFHSIRNEKKQKYGMTRRVELSQHDNGFDKEVKRTVAIIKKMLNNIRTNHAHSIREYPQLTEILLKWVCPYFIS